MVDTLVLETSAERRGGSSPPWGTKLKYTACLTVKVVVNYKRRGFESLGLVVYFNLG